MKLIAMKYRLSIVTLALALVATVSAASAQAVKPTVVLVHGAFAESSSWNGVLTKLIERGFPVVAAANPLRGVRTDANFIATVLAGIAGPIILVGHSYGGTVITNAVGDNENVKALVYVGAFAPDLGETAEALTARFPGSTLGPTLDQPGPAAAEGQDVYIQQSKFHAQFAADVSAEEASLMATTRRPVVEAAFHDVSGAPAWKATPSWFIYGSRDLNIPAAAHAFMARRADARRTVEIKGASHVVMVSHPDAVARIIREAAGDM